MTEKQKRKQGSCTSCGGPTSVVKAKRCRSCFRSEKRDDAALYRYRRSYRLRKKYNLSVEAFDALWIATNGCCGICKVELKLPERNMGQQPDVAVVDHDHGTGQVRGLLCNSCNRGLGFFKDNLTILESAARYLKGDTT